MSTNTYQILDSGNFRRLEQVGAFRLIRPAAQAVWAPEKNQHFWQKFDAEFTRAGQGEGSWKRKNTKIPESWPVTIAHGVRMSAKLTDFGHIGLFPEHHQNSALLDLMTQMKKNKSVRVLNLFAYTGALSIACAAAGAEVTHLDASKTSTLWAKENASLNSGDLKIRWIVEDVLKFVAREKRRGSKYDVIILDPPSFGRGSKGEVWKVESDLLPLLRELRDLRSDDFSYLQLSCHTPNYTPIALENILRTECIDLEGEIHSLEMSVNCIDSPVVMPAGACARFIGKARFKGPKI